MPSRMKRIAAIHSNGAKRFIEAPPNATGTPRMRSPAVTMTLVTGTSASADANGRSSTSISPSPRIPSIIGCRAALPSRTTSAHVVAARVANRIGRHDQRVVTTSDGDIDRNRHILAQDRAAGSTTLAA